LLLSHLHSRLDRALPLNGLAVIPAQSRGRTPWKIRELFDHTILGRPATFTQAITPHRQCCALHMPRTISFHYIWTHQSGRLRLWLCCRPHRLFDTSTIDGSILSSSQVWTVLRFSYGSKASVTRQRVVTVLAFANVSSRSSFWLCLDTRRLACAN
jgi:hypothetical protein